MHVYNNIVIIIKGHYVPAAVQSKLNKFELGIGNSII